MLFLSLEIWINPLNLGYVFIVPANMFYNTLDIYFNTVSLGIARISIIDELDLMLISIFIEIYGLLGEAWIELKTTKCTSSFFLLSS